MPEPSPTTPWDQAIEEASQQAWMPLPRSPVIPMVADPDPRIVPLRASSNSRIIPMVARPLTRPRRKS